jgi:hypothetical protein
MTVTSHDLTGYWEPGRHRRPAGPPSELRSLARRVGPSVVGAVLGASVFGLTHRSLVDDAYITLAYAQTLGLHGEWGMVEGLTSNTATSPLNVLLLGIGTAVFRDALAAVGVLLVVLFGLAGWALDRTGRMLGIRAWRAPVVGLAYLATSPLLLSTVGLESYLAVVLLLVVVTLLLERRPWSVGVVAGLLVLTRPDLAVFAVPAVLMSGRAWWRSAVSAVATTVPWFVWSWWNLGSALPDSVLLKAGSPWGPWSYATGPQLWWSLMPAAVALSVIPAVIGLICLPFWFRRDLAPVAVVLGGGSLIHAAAFIGMDTAPFHWYYVPACCGCGLVAVLSAARAGPSIRRIASVATLLVTAACAASVLGDGLPRDRAPIASNWASATEYKRIAEQLPRGSVVQSPGEIGTLAYYCDCRVLDGFADPALLRPLRDKRIAEASPLATRLLRWNYARFDTIHAASPQPVDFTMPVWAVPAHGAPMVGSWGDGRAWTLEPSAAVPQERR